MKTAHLPLLFTLGILPLLLTACPKPRPFDPPVQLSFTLPDAAEQQKLKLAALSFQVQDDNTVKSVVFSQGYVYGKTASISLYKEQLAALSKDARCVTPFSTGEARDMVNVTLNPTDVDTCNLYFLAYDDQNGDNIPTREEERYITHDIYAYASSALIYSMTTQDGTSTESGTRTQGWSLVRHTVLQPTATPGKYVVTMNSVPSADEQLPIRLHEPTDFMTSMNIGGRP